MQPQASSPLEDEEDREHAKIARAVAKLLRPSIMEAVDSALQRNLQEIKADVISQAWKIQEAEQRISDIEGGLEALQSSSHSAEQVIQSLLDKVADMKNCSRRRNSRKIGLPETYKPAELHRICSIAIPEALGITSPCLVERAHRLGPLIPE